MSSTVYPRGLVIWSLAIPVVMYAEASPLRRMAQDAVEEDDAGLTEPWPEDDHAE